MPRPNNDSIIRTVVVAGALAALASGFACSEPHTEPPPSAAAVVPGIDQARAKELAALKYNELFANHFYWRDVVRDSYHVFLPITAADFEVVGASDTAWLVVCDGLVGQIVHGRVAKDGDWVDLSHVGFATH